MSSLPEVEFTITDDDVRALRNLRARRMRFPLLEWLLHTVALAAALLLTTFAFARGRPHRLPVYLGVLAAAWAVAWGYLAFFLFRPTPESERWFEQLRSSPVLAKGNVRVRRNDDRGLTVVTESSTRSFAPNDLEDAVHDTDHFYVRTAAGQVVIVPRRAFPSQDDFADFVASVETRADKELRRDEEGRAR